MNMQISTTADNEKEEEILKGILKEANDPSTALGALVASGRATLTSPSTKTPRKKKGRR